ncbi:Phosphatidate cytidylyltransferase,CDP-diglyceride synthase,Predicted CDP-diglyceride synthetase/phosphatidate cytidylyltransferase,Cytidylyltransferase family [Chlamydia serpentis]|uniref:Phosphatidate cytidylyltransferase n=1 Tax=Chlamydia serpentis TaxID=1967782 RepID=A0A2R8FBK6_9CHLA|nr:phosphatidate cytidylyltransferase [Chlamydia serpentis]SPN73686.1 Phosphatidate cytidylyltransferase,CDP-diglyceride synthase,Predicted CDP-diglyceride synthetase/phosphatidate cytidylyltransferase,Cytidylyltransferase family [Chlamydia serpentis]
MLNLNKFKSKSSAYGDLFQRVVVHSLVLTFLVLLLYSSLFPLTSFALGFITAICGAVGTYEYSSMAKVKMHYPLRMYSTLGSFLFIALSFLAIRLRHSLPEYSSALPWTVLIIWVVWSIFKVRKSEIGPLQLSGVTLFSILYVGIPIRLFLHILYGFIDTQEPYLGIWWASFLIATTKGADIFGYFFGKAFGNKKITPQISPNKTVIGFIAGCLGATLISFIFFLQIPSRFMNYFPIPAILIPLGLVLGITGFFGDIIESMFKRDAHLKNSNKLKAVGGMLDTLDSLILSTPIVYLFLLITQAKEFIR